MTLDYVAQSNIKNISKYIKFPIFWNYNYIIYLTPIINSNHLSSNNVFSIPYKILLLLLLALLGLVLMQFTICSYPEQAVSYRVDDTYIINEPSLKRLKFRYFNISNLSLNKNLEHRKPHEKSNYKLHIYDLAQITIQYSPQYGSQCKFPHSFDWKVYKPFIFSSFHDIP